LRMQDYLASSDSFVILPWFSCVKSNPAPRFFIWRLNALSPRMSDLGEQTELLNCLCASQKIAA
jgi:hypothetical protein